MTTYRNAGDRCPTCPQDKPQRLIVVNGTLVCWRCDSVEDWPSVRKGTATIERGGRG